jgi:SAM-dependent methyltransferase
MLLRRKEQPATDLPSPWFVYPGAFAPNPGSIHSDSSLPALFKGLTIRRISPAEIELAQQTFNEEGLYLALQSYARFWSKWTRRAARILDVCSASGLCALRIARTIPTQSVTLVDIDEEALEQAAGHFVQAPGLYRLAADAVDFQGDGPFDLILMNSAYHHIEDDRKSAFLCNAARLLSPDGLIFIGDHFLAPYDTPEQFQERVVEFYDALIHELERRGAPRPAIGVIRQAAFHCWMGKTEYKVAFRRLQQDVCRLSDFGILARRSAWSPHSDPQKAELVGSLALVVGPLSMREGFLSYAREQERHGEI